MHSIDFWVIGIYLLGTVSLGLWLGRGQKDQADFFVGGRQLPAWALLLSIVATETSTVTFLSIPGKAFVEGGSFYFLQVAIGYMVGRLLVVALLLPIHFSGRPLTAYAVFEEKFGVAARQVASVIFLLARTAGDGLRLFLTALALQQAFAWSPTLCVVGLAVVTGVYAVFGGVKSVVWNDCIQFAVYTLGAVVVIAIVLSRLPGGVSQVVEFAHETHRDRLFDFAFDPAQQHVTFWSGLLGGAFLSLATHGADQLIVQRYLCAKSQRAAAWALGLSGPLVFLQFAMFLAIGVGLACYYAQANPSLLSLAGDQALASFVVSDMPAGLRGLILAAVFAAAMSTLSSSVNASASSLLSDLWAPWSRHWSDRTCLVAGRLLTAAFTAAQAVVAMVAYYWAAERAIVDQVLAIAGFAAGLLLGLYFLGLVVERAASWQAIAALALGGLATTVTWQLGIHPFWFPVVGSGVTFVAGLLLTMMSPLPGGAQS